MQSSSLFSDSFTLFVSPDNNEIYYSGGISESGMSDLLKELKKCESFILKQKEELGKAASSAARSVDASGCFASISVGGGCGGSSTLFDSKYFTVSIKPIRLTIQSHGGSLFPALALTDHIRLMKVPVDTVVSGFCASAATFLTLAGQRRYMTRHSSMLIHEIKAGYWGKMSALADDFDNLQKISQLVISYYESHTKLSRDVLTEILKRDVYWSAEECLERGLIDEIL